ncbi:hypothetical protein CDAR_617291, partial [Caerostris darwini]
MKGGYGVTSLMERCARSSLDRMEEYPKTHEVRWEGMPRCDGGWGDVGLPGALSMQCVPLILEKVLFPLYIEQFEDYPGKFLESIFG